jgi:ribosomal protein S18 acetylase RimI-like enzyme
MNIKFTDATPKNARTITLLLNQTRFESYRKFNNNIKKKDFLLEGPKLKKKIVLYKHNIKSKNNKWIVAKLNRKIIGFISAYKINNQKGKIRLLFIKPELQGKGIGKQLMNEILIWFKDQAIDVVIISVVKDNMDAIKFYEKFGFASINKDTKPYVTLRQNQLQTIKMLKQINES